jgi:hypothetical protein
MTQATPQMGPGEFSGSVASSETSMPSQQPPASAGDQEGIAASGLTIAGAGDAAPSLPAMEEGVVAGIGTWQNNKRITSLWCINQNRNSWVGVSGIGWKKLANNSDSAIVALTMLGAHAREKGSVVNYREESDGMIHEMYVW